MPEGRRLLPTCTVLKSTLYEALNAGAARMTAVSGSSVELEAAGPVEQEQNRVVMSATLACLHHVAFSDDIAARSAMVERGCLFPLIRIALSGGSSGGEGCGPGSSARGSVATTPITAACPWDTSTATRRGQAVSILLAFAGFRRAGNAVSNDDEHVYVKTALQRLWSTPLVRILARSYINGNGSSPWAELSLLSENTTSPALIWDDSMRAAVLAFADAQSFDHVDEDAAVLASFRSGGPTTSAGSAVATKTSSSMFTRALGPVMGFSHKRLTEEPLVGGIYLKPFVEQRYRGYTFAGSDNGTDSKSKSTEVMAVGRDHGTQSYFFGLDPTRFASDLVYFIEVASEASSLVRGDKRGLAAAQSQYGLSTAKSVAQAAAASGDRALEVLFALRALCKLLDGGLGGSGLGESTFEDQVLSTRIGAACCAQLLHHARPIFSCANGAMQGTSYSVCEGRDLETCIAALRVVQRACRVVTPIEATLNGSPAASSFSSVQEATPSSSSSESSRMTPGQVFARNTVEAGVLWMLLEPLRRQQPCPISRVGEIMETLMAIVACSPLASANLSGLGVTVELMTALAGGHSGDVPAVAAAAENRKDNNASKIDESLRLREMAASVLSMLAAQPSCGSQVRSSLLRMLPSRLLHLILQAGDEKKSRQFGRPAARAGARCVALFDSDQDTAELYWNAACRDELRVSLRALRAEIVQRIALEGSGRPATTSVSSAGSAVMAATAATALAPSEAWSVPNGFLVRFTAYTNSFVVSGVFVRRFLRDTTVTLSNPTAFAVDLIRVLAQPPSAVEGVASGSGMPSVTPAPVVTTENLSLLVRAFVALVMQNPELATSVAQAGMIPPILHRLVDATGEGDTQQACLSVVTQLVLHSQFAVTQVSCLTLRAGCLLCHVFLSRARSLSDCFSFFISSFCIKVFIAPWHASRPNWGRAVCSAAALRQAGRPGRPVSR